MNEVPQDVIGGDVAFLGAVDRRGRNHQAEIDHARRLHLAAITTGQPDGDDAHFPGLGERRHQICGISAGGDTDQGVACPTLRQQLPYKHMLEAEIVADGGNHRQIGHEVGGGKSRAPGRDRVHEFHRDMGGVAARAAIAHREQPSAAAVDIGKRLRGGNQNRRMFAEEARIGFAGVAGFLLDRMQQRRVEPRRRLRLAVQEWIERLEVSVVGHDLPPYSAADSRIASISACASPSSLRICNVSAASSSLIRLMAKPTWTSTQSPMQDSTGCSSLTMQAMLICRLTPPTSTVASFLETSLISMIRPGMTRHMTRFLPIGSLSVCWI